MLEIPQVPSKILVTDSQNPEKQIMQESQPIYFIDRVEYPKEGGILVYKYGGELEQFDFDPSKYKAEEERVLRELNNFMSKTNFSLVGQDHKPVNLIPNELINLKANQRIINRVDLLYPEKGCIDALALSLANQVKRYLKEEAMFFSYKWTIISLLTFIFLPFKCKIKVVERWLDGWSGFGIVTTEPRLMKPEYYTEFCRELKKFLEIFLKDLGISGKVSEKTAWITAEIIERDSAYRLRLEDLASATSAEALTNTRKEIKRVLSLFQDREQMSQKLKNVANQVSKLIILATYSRRLRKSFNKALREINFKNFQLDAIDSHQALRMKGYDFSGKSYEERIREYNNLYNGNPPKVSYIVAQ